MITKDNPILQKSLGNLPGETEWKLSWEKCGPPVPLKDFEIEQSWT